MRWLRFTAAGRTAYGILEGERIAEIAGDPFAGYERTPRSHALGAVKLEVPVIPRTFYCAGLNYGAHVIEQAQKRGVAPDFPKQPDIGYRANNALIAHDEPVIIPRDATDKVQYEGELVVVIAEGQASERGRRVVLRARLHHRQRCERAQLAALGPHAVARQEHR